MVERIRLHDPVEDHAGIDFQTIEVLAPEPRIKHSRVFQPLLKPARFKGAYGGRGSGKSHFFAELLLDEMLLEPTRAVGLREIQKSIDQSSKLLIADKIRVHNLGGAFTIRDSYIECYNGGIITFQGMQNRTAEAARGLEGYRIAWFDEAHRASAMSLGILRPTMRAPNSEMWFSWNPLSPMDPVDKLLRGPYPPQNSITVEVNYDDNEWFPAELKEEMEYDKRRDPERYKHVWLGAYQTRSEARVFRNFTIEEFNTPPEAKFYFGADWGFAKDPTVLVRCFIEGRRLYVDAEAWQVGCEMDRTPLLFDSLEPAQPRMARKWIIVADSSNPQAISYMRRNGYPRMQPAVKGMNSVEEGIEFLKSYDIIIHPRCAHVWEEISGYSYEVDPMTEQVLPKLADKKNHTIDALRYAVEAIRRRPNPPMWGSY